MVVGGGSFELVGVSCGGGGGSSVLYLFIYFYIVRVFLGYFNMLYILF